MLGLNEQQSVTLRRALLWSPRIYTIRWTTARTIKAIVRDDKPVATIYDDSKVRELIEKHRLSAIGIKEDFIVFKEENRDIAELLFHVYRNGSRYGHAVYYFVFGICLGYPIENVVDFAITNGPDDPSLCEVCEVGHQYWLESITRLTPAA